MNKDPALYLDHILESIERIETYVSGMDRERFSTDWQVQDAVFRRLEIIGEAVKNLPGDIRADNPQVPWRRIAGTRDKLIHDYLGIDVDLIWSVIRDWLPELKADVKTILDALDAQSGSD